ncbi:hypothetical protein C8Q75DRAFT_387645 [Abortiporus biennis]|nr:hypothetical protein C8Q75DRAFT_387645 [Abortiporus biennis]
MSFRPSLTRLAQSVTTKPLNEASATLLPPIPLFRRILRAHRYLPPDLRSLGDVYVRSEFRHHRKVDNAWHAIAFLSQWKIYLDELPTGPEAQHFKGKKLDPTLIEKMSPEQIGQLYEFMHATKEIWKPAPDAEGDQAASSSGEDVKPDDSSKS